MIIAGIVLIILGVLVLIGSIGVYGHLTENPTPERIDRRRDPRGR